MIEKKGVKVQFNAPLQPGDTVEMTVGCRANNPNICKYNGIQELCAFERDDGICQSPSKAWKKQYLKLTHGEKHDTE